MNIAARKWLRVPRVIVPLLLAAATALLAETNSPASSGGRYLLIVETSSGMKKRMDNVQATVGNLLASGINGQLQIGDTVGLWTYDEELYAGQFPLQRWTPQGGQRIATVVMDYLSKQPAKKAGDFSKVVGPVAGLVKKSDKITIILITDGSDKMEGTPFDDDINARYRKDASQQKKALMPFVTVLRARHGDYVGGKVSNAPWPVEFPPFPPEPTAPPITKAEPAPKPVEPPATKPEAVSPAPVQPPAEPAPAVVATLVSNNAAPVEVAVSKPAVETPPEPIPPTETKVEENKVTPPPPVVPAEVKPAVAQTPPAEPPPPVEPVNPPVVTPPVETPKVAVAQNPPEPPPPTPVAAKPAPQEPPAPAITTTAPASMKAAARNTNITRAAQATVPIPPGGKRTNLLIGGLALMIGAGILIFAQFRRPRRMEKISLITRATERK